MPNLWSMLDDRRVIATVSRPRIQDTRFGNHQKTRMCNQQCRRICWLHASLFAFSARHLCPAMPLKRPAASLSKSRSGPSGWSKHNEMRTSAAKAKAKAKAKAAKAKAATAKARKKKQLETKLEKIARKLMTERLLQEPRSPPRGSSSNLEIGVSPAPTEYYPNMF